MRKFYKIIILVAVIYLAGIAAFAFLSGRKIGGSSISEQDVLFLNDIAYVILNLDSVKSDKAFVITDTAGNVIYDSRGGADGTFTVQTAIKNRYPYTWHHEW